MLLPSRSVLHHSAVHAGGLTSAWPGRSCRVLVLVGDLGVASSVLPDDLLCFSTALDFYRISQVFKHVEVLHCSDFGPLPVLEVTVCQGSRAPMSTLPTGRHVVTLERGMLILQLNISASVHVAFAFVLFSLTVMLWIPSQSPFQCAYPPLKRLAGSDGNIEADRKAFR